MNKLSALALVALTFATLGGAGCTIVTHPRPDAQSPTAAPQPAAQPAPASTPAPQPQGRAPGRMISIGRIGSGPVAPLPGGPAPAGPGKMTASNMFGAQAGSPTALKGDVYWLKPGTTALPDLGTLTPVTTLWAEVLNTPVREFTEGFPGVDPQRLEWFAIRYTGQFAVATAGDYTFKLHSKDGAKVFVDNQLVVDNDGQHAPQAKNGQVKLTAGQHSLRVDYFMGPKGVAVLQLMVMGPDKQEKPWLPAF